MNIPARTVWLDNLGYEPHALHLVVRDGPLGETLYSSNDRSDCLQWVKRHQYKLVVNPRFKGYPKCEEEVAQFYDPISKAS